MEKKIRIGHIGTKHDHSSAKLDCVQKFPDLYEVVGIVEEDDAWWEKVKNTPCYTKVPRMTEEQLFNAGCDAIMVEGFELDLPAVGKRCIENGIHIHMDKPAGDDLDTFTETLRIAKQKNLAVQLAYMYRYNVAVQDCLQLIREGQMGEIHSVTAVMNTLHSPEKRAWLGNFRAGDMFYLGCHMIDLIHLIQGVPETITPYLTCSGFNGVNAIDEGTVILQYAKGVSIAQANSTEVNGYGRRQLVVCGTKGTYEIYPLENPVHTKYTDISFHTTYGDRHVDRGFNPDYPGGIRYDTMMLEFARIVRGEIENPYSYEFELDTQRMVLASCGYPVDFKTPVSL